VIGLVRLAVVMVLAMAAVHLLLTVYARSLRRERLEEEWDAAPGPGSREEYIARAMAAYRPRLRRRLFWLVWVMPAVAVAALVYYLNFA